MCDRCAQAVTSVEAYTGAPKGDIVEWLLEHTAFPFEVLDAEDVARATAALGDLP